MTDAKPTNTCTCGHARFTHMDAHPHKCMDFAPEAYEDCCGFRTKLPQRDCPCRAFVSRVEG